MSFNTKIRALADRLPSLEGYMETEEATKTALVMPFLAALGYDVFNPQEVVPEFTADYGTKKGEKVDYAIKRDGKVIILIECKKASMTLATDQKSQLYRYFMTTEARLGILTNGKHYQFFSDLEEPNKMDERPFLELDLENLHEDQLAEVQKLECDNFDMGEMLGTASELKYTKEIRRVLSAQYEAPDEDFVKFFFGKVCPNSRFIGVKREAFAGFVQRALKQYVNDRIESRLRSALAQESTPAEAVPIVVETEQLVTETEPVSADPKIVTTEEEIEGYHIVKSIVRQCIAPERVLFRDSKTYMAILVDNNNRKPLCRLWFNRSQKYIGLLDDNKVETKHAIEKLDDIFTHADVLKAAAKRYAEGG
jgi:predicted type IV restriction endonuclease